MKQTKLLALTLSCLMALALFILPARASGTDPAQHAATLLNELGLFQGVGENPDSTPDFDLGGVPTREQAVTMLVRLLGKDAEATGTSYDTPFTDVSDWAKPYVGYAYKNGLTAGTTATTFSGSAPVTPTQYLTFVLRALGYSSESDFQWDRAWELTQLLSITAPGEYEDSAAPFTRGDVAIISAAALSGAMKDSAHTLLSYLNSSGVFKDSKLVLMDLEVVDCKEDLMCFAFFPIEGSPNTYTSFKVDKVTVNGLPGTIKQYQNTKAAIKELPELEALYPSTFNYSLVSYDEKAAQEAAEHSFDAGNGASFPILIFSFTCTGTLESSETVQEVFSEAVYINEFNL